MENVKLNLVLQIIMAYANMTPEEAKSHKPTVIFVDDNNAITRKANYEKHGLLC